MSDPIATPDEIQRVAQYWEQVKALACRHEFLTFQAGESRPICSACDRPINFLSDLQIEELAKVRISGA